MIPFLNLLILNPLLPHLIFLICQIIHNSQNPCGNHTQAKHKRRNQKEVPELLYFLVFLFFWKEKVKIHHLFLFPVKDHRAKTGKPVCAHLFMRHNNPLIRPKRNNAQPQSLDPLHAHLKILQKTSCIIHMGNGILIPACIELKDSRNIPDDLCAKVQSPPFTENTAAAGIQIPPVLAQDAGHALLLKKEINRRRIPVALLLPQDLQIPLQGNRNAAYGNVSFPADLYKTLQGLLVHPGPADIHACILIRTDNGIIHKLHVQAFPYLRQSHPAKLLSLPIRNLQNTGGTQIIRQHQTHRFCLFLWFQLYKRLLPPVKPISLA